MKITESRPKRLRGNLPTVEQIETELKDAKAEGAGDRH